MIQLSQEDGSRLTLRQVPTRIVSLVPSVTENLILFGLVPAGRTSFCIEPKGVVEKIPVVGGTKTPKISQILKLNPDLVIANKEENRKEDIEELRSRGVPVWVNYPRKVDDVPPLMEDLGKLGGDPSRVARFVSAARNAIASRKDRTVRTLVLIWKDPWMAAGSDTYTSDLISAAGGENVVPSAAGRYPVLSDGEILRLKPSVILLPTEPYAFEDSDLKYWEENFARAGTPVKVLPFSGEDLTWPGPRMLSGLQTLERLLHGG